MFNEFVHVNFNDKGFRKVRVMPSCAFGSTPPISIIREYDALVYILHSMQRREPDVYIVVVYYGEAKLSYRPHHQATETFKGEEIDDTILKCINIFTLHNYKEYLQLPKWFISSFKSLQTGSPSQYPYIKWAFVHARPEFRDTSDTADVSDDIFSIGTLFEAMMRHIKKACPTRQVFTIMSESVLKWKNPDIRAVQSAPNTPREYLDTYINCNFYDFSRASNPDRGPVYPLQHFIRFHPERLTANDVPCQDGSWPAPCIDIENYADFITSMSDHFNGFHVSIHPCIWCTSICFCWNC